MARYTTNYGNLVDTEFAPLLEVLAAYPIYDEEHRNELNTKIYNRFRFREIGFETAAMFTHYFKTTLGEIMPMYNELFRTADMDYDIFEDADYTTTTNASSSDSSTSSGTTSGTSHGSHGHSDTPQGSFVFSDVTANTYLSDADVDDGSTSGSTSGSATSSGSSHAGTHVQGKMPGASRAAMIEEYRKTIINIDARILDDLEMCFMGIY